MRLKCGLLISAALLALGQPRASRVFDVASVNPAHARRAADGRKDVGAPAAATLEADHLTFRARSINLFALVVEAYGLKFCRPLANNCEMISGGPAWLTRDVFDIDAKSPSGSEEYTTMQLRSGDAPQLQEELRNLLSDRFHLKAHFEERQLPVYAFAVADHGIRMKPGTAGAPAKIIFRAVDLPDGTHATQVIAVRSTVRELADLYAKFMDRPVIDATGLKGRFDFTVQYEADTDTTGPFAAVTARTLFEAFGKQAGLNLRATRGPVQVLVIESATRPSVN